MNSCRAKDGQKFDLKNIGHTGHPALIFNSLNTGEKGQVQMTNFHFLKIAHCGQNKK